MYTVIELHKSSAVVLAFIIASLANLAVVQVAVSSSGAELPQAVTYNISITAEVVVTGPAGPGDLWLKVYGIPPDTDYQQVQAALGTGEMRFIEGREIWFIEDNGLSFPGTFTYSATFTVTVDTRNITPLPSVPLTSVSGMDEYLAADDYVTLSAGVVAKAQELMGAADDDIVDIVEEFADWITKNVVYDKDFNPDWKYTDTEVLTNKRGVCDEFATLLIGFCRAVDIPARHRLGYLVEDSGPTAHAWAEVWINPSYGWLQVDLTGFDLGSARKIATADNMGGSDARVGGRGPDDAEMLLSPLTTRIIGQTEISTADKPSTITIENLDNTWDVTVTNNMLMPLLDNITVKRIVRGQTSDTWLLVSQEVVIISPHGSHTFSLARDDEYFVYTRMSGDGLQMLNQQSVLPIDEETLIYVMIVVIIGAVVVIAVSVARR